MGTDNSGFERQREQSRQWEARWRIDEPFTRTADDLEADLNKQASVAAVERAWLQTYRGTDEGDAPLVGAEQHPRVGTDCQHRFAALHVPDATDSDYNHHVGMHVCRDCGQTVAPQEVLDSGVAALRWLSAAWHAKEQRHD